MSQPDRTSLPIRRETSLASPTGRLRVRNPIGPHRAPHSPEGAPNVLLVLIDDAGFGNRARSAARSRRRTTRAWPKAASATTGSTSRRCARRRAAPLTGRNTAGSASIGEFAGRVPRLLRDLPTDCAPLPRILRDNGTAQQRSASGI